MITLGTGFSGIGVPDLCGRLLGMETLWQIEKDSFCQQVLKKNFPEVPNLYGDIFDCHPEHADLEVFGFPCQPFSVAGQKKGEKDPRYLVPEMLRVIDESSPSVVIFENVPGFGSLNDGTSFKRLLEALTQMGYDATWSHLRASDYQAPHTRERWICVAVSRSFGQWGRFGHWQGRHLLHDQDGLTPKDQPEREGWLGWVGQDHAARELGDPMREGLEGQRQPIGVPSPYAAAWLSSLGYSGDPQGTEAQPRLGRIIDGVAGWVDGFTPYPARPADEPYGWECDRVTDRVELRKERIKALGNTMALDMMFDVMQAIKEFMETQTLTVMDGGG